MDFYSVLGVQRNASADEIKAAFREKALKYHPDRHADSPARAQAEAARLFKQAKDAYEVLSDGAARSLYNAGGRPGAGFSSPGSGQAARGPAGHGGAYGSGYGDPFASSTDFGTPRARSGWSNFRYQQRQHNRHEWFSRPFAAAARGLGRGDALWHAAMGGALMLGFLTIAPLTDAAWESRNSGKLFRHIAPERSTEEEEERLRRRMARMRGYMNATTLVIGVAGPSLEEALFLTELISGSLLSKNDTPSNRGNASLPESLAHRLNVHYDQCSRVAYVQVATVADLEEVADACRRAAKQACQGIDVPPAQSMAAVQQWQRSTEVAGDALLLALFASCDMVVWAQPRSAPDPALLHQLRSLQAARQALGPRPKAGAPAKGAGGPPTGSQRVKRLPVLALVFPAADNMEADGLAASWEGMVRSLLKHSRALAPSAAAPPLCTLDPARAAFFAPRVADARATALATLDGAAAGPSTGAALRAFVAHHASALRQHAGAPVSPSPAAGDRARPRDGGGAAAAARWLVACADPGYAHSLELCGRAVKQARAAYQAGLPERYAAAMHMAALARAQRAFWAAAAGSAAGACAARLERECTAEWAAGRRRCEAVSLTWRACRLAPHGLSEPHCSGARLLLANEDGTSRHWHADPFSLSDIVPRALVPVEGNAKPCSRLMRIWVATPAAPVAFAMQPALRLQASGGLMEIACSARE
ncbi:hypothetical protein WJX81_008442 [Elliptochloris bilobata]|uniref:Nonsense-mediated mRNA decay factor SMG8 n=1 Tax=Elliptochloris bilobata TaxID=381761 RepID=A0AAW1S917_9CHLO